MSYVYVTYSTRDYSKRQTFLDDLKAAGFEVGMMAHSDKDRIQEAACVVVLLTPHAPEDNLVLGAIDLAQLLRKPLYAVLLDGDLKSSKPKELSKAVPVFDVTQDYDAGMIELVSQLRKHIPTSPLGSRQLFLSHSTDDASFVDPLVKDLGKRNLTIWRAPDSILPGEEWVAAIERGLSTATHLLLVMSPAAVASKWVELEMNTAIRLERDGLLTIIPLDYQPCKAPLLWGGYQAVNFRGSYADGLAALIKRLGLG